MTASEAPGRSQIYYWKCDRAAAFHGTEQHPVNDALEAELRAELQAAFPGSPLTLRPAAGQGNHRTFLAEIGGEAAFVRVEDGPEGDDYLEVESHLLDAVARCGVPVPRVLAVDAKRSRVPFAWQALERIPHPDLNAHCKRGALRLEDVAEKIGAAVARWQAVEVGEFGPFRVPVLRERRQLVGFHAGYEDYFRLQLDRHLAFLGARGFLTAEESRTITATIDEHRALLALESGCLVHKDLALWNILGSETEIAAFIDWDDAISGDPMDDVSLLGCFYDGSTISRALEGYASVRPLPAGHLRRFWLHLLRNMIVKAVIRVGAGYFERDDGFFLIGSGGSGEDFRRFTRERLALALRGLATNAALSIL
jgi:aminoglycoside phosphotransferase (APT) family kinase protein